MNEPTKLKCYVTPGWKGLPGVNVLTYWAHSSATKKVKCCEDSL